MIVPGYFTSGRIQDGKIWLWKKHIERFQQTAHQLGWDMNLSESDLLKMMVTQYSASNLTQARFRLVHSGTEIYIELFPNHEKEVLKAELIRADSPSDYKLGIKSLDKTAYQFSDSSADVILMYTYHGISEFNIGNVVFQSEKRFSTPIRELGFSGIGLSTFKEFLEYSGQSMNSEKIPVGTIDLFSKVWLVNAVRGLVKVVFETTEHKSANVEELCLIQAVDEFFETHPSSVSL